VTDEFTCNLCRDAQQGPNCSTCPEYRRFHYVEGTGGAPHTVDFFVVVEHPEVQGPSSDVVQHTPFGTDIEQMIRRTVLDVLPSKMLSRDHPCVIRTTYAIRCNKPKPNKKIMTACSPLFFEELETYARPDRPIIILGCGGVVAKTLGITKGRYTDLHGKPTLVHLPSGRPAILVSTFSPKHLVSKTGFYSVFLKHLEELIRCYYQGAPKEASKEAKFRELTKDYILPSSVQSLAKHIDHVIEYHTKDTTADNHIICLDAETNTKFANRKKLKLATLHVSWAAGKALTIPFEHPRASWTPEELEEVRHQIHRLVTCKKPKIGHNFKYDLEVLENKGFTVENFAWDTMLAEHTLEEDKKGYYDLKTLVELYLPEFAGYEDELHRYKKEHGTKDGPALSKLKGAEKKLVEDDRENGFIDIPLRILHLYGNFDVDTCRQLFRLQRIRMRQEDLHLARKRKPLMHILPLRKVVKSIVPHKNPLERLTVKHAVPISQTLAAMERGGVRVDREYLSTLQLEIAAASTNYEDSLQEMIPKGVFPEEFNFNSGPQLRRLLYSTGYHHPETGELICYRDKVEPPRTETGEISLNAQFLRGLAIQHDCVFADTLLKYRKLTKANNTFLRNIFVLSEEDGRMHTTYNLHGTSTGRLSSNNENMQNVPHFLAGHNIKKAFIPDDGYVFVNADAKAAEVRVYAGYSKDKNLIQALCDGMDPHSFFSSHTLSPRAVLRGIPSEFHESTLQTVGIDFEHDWSYEDFQNRGSLPEEYGKRLEKLRKNIKRVVFGILYGASQYKIASIVGIPDEQAQKIIDVLFQMFPSIAEYINITKQQVQTLGVVETYFGRRRRTNLKGLTRRQISRAQRQSVNFKIQSTSSDIVMDTIRALHGPLTRDLRGDLLLTVHDSVGFQIPQKYASQVPDFIQEYGVRQVAKKYPWLEVPFQWDVEMGPSYGEVVDFKTYFQEEGVVEAKYAEDYEAEIREELQNSA